MGFMKYLKKGKRGLPGEAILTCSSGQSWKVKLSLDADGLFLSKGWDKFFKENNLCERDFLVFRYDGGKTMKFDVRVFGANGWPKVEASDSGKEIVCKQLENYTSQLVIVDMPLNTESNDMEKVEVNGLSHFCWTIGQDENQEKLPIPMGFMKYLKKGRRGLPGEAILTCSSGQSWKVNLSIDADGLFLSKGWGKFFKENNLCERDFLLFRYDGGKNIKFDVRVFGANGLPKVKGSDSGKENVCKQVENNTFQRVKDECLSLDLQPEISTHKRKRDELVETGVTTMALVRYPINEVQSPWSKSHAFSSSSPFFRCILDECSVKKYILKIPKAACPRDIFPSEKTDIILRNSNLQFWIVKVQPTTKAYTFRTAGWRKFVQENDLKEGYVCVFELMQIKELLVHVFH